MPIKELPPRVRRGFYIAVSALVLVAALPLFNFSGLRHRIERDTTDSLGRNLQVGAVRLALLPRPNVTLEDVRLYEPDGRRVFAEFRSARFSLAWPALTHGKAELVDGRVEGLHAVVSVGKDGKLSCDDLLTRKPRENSMAWQLNRIDLVNAALDWTGRDKQLMKFSGVDMHVLNPESEDGRLDMEGQVAAPEWGGAMKVESGLRVNREHLTAEMKDFGVAINATSPDWRDAHLELRGDLTATAMSPLRTVLNKAQSQFNVKHGDQLWRASFTTPEIRASEAGLSTGVLNAQISIKGSDREMAADIDVEKLAAESGTGNLVADRAAIKLRLMDALQNATLDVQTALRLDGWSKATLDGFMLNGGYHHASLPGGAIKLDLGGKASIDLFREHIDISSKGALDGSPLDAALTLDNFVDPHYVIDVALNKLDLTPYLPGVASGDGDLAGMAIDWRWLKNLKAHGDVRLGELDLGSFKTVNVQTHFDARDSKLMLDPLVANIYGGQMNGLLAIDTAGDAPSVTLKQKLSGMEVAGLLKDTVGISGIAGRGDINVDLNTHAGSLNEARRRLAGHAEFKLSHGTLNGIDVSDLLRGLRLNIARLAGTSLKADTARRTRFSELEAEFDLKDGVATSRNLRVNAPLITIGGDGKLDFAKGEINYLLSVSPSGGSGVPELDALRGTPIPISITGTFASPSYSVDTTAIKAKLAAQSKPKK